MTLEFALKRFLFFLQLYHTLDQGFRSSARFDGLCDVVKGQSGFMEPAADCRNIRTGFNLMGVGLNGYGSNLLNTFLSEK